MEKFYRYLGLCLLFGLALLVQVNHNSAFYYSAPDLVLLILFYQLSYASEYFRVVAAWVVGLFVDVWSMAWLGENALIFALIAFLWQLSWRWLSSLSSLSQGLIVGVCVGCYRLLRSLNSGYYPELGSDLALGFALGLLLHCLIWALISWPQRCRI